MLINGSKLRNYPVLSLHIGGSIAKTVEEVVDPNDLKIVAFTVDGPQTGDGDHGDILDTRSIREFSNIGMIVDSIDDFVSEGEVVKFDKIMALNFSLIGLNVKTKKGTKLGKVVDFIVDTNSMMVIQFIVKRPIMKSFLDSELIIGRSQIAEVNDYELIVKGDESKIKKENLEKDFVPNFVNPFRKPEIAPVEEKKRD